MKSKPPDLMLIPCMEINYSKDKGLITYVIDGKITSNDMRQLQAARNQLSSSSTFKVLAIVTAFKGYSSLEALKNALLGDLKMLPKLAKYAIVTDIFWLRKVVSSLNYVVPKSELRAFTLKDQKQAEKWLGS
ncbi:STAS/SEC14 domain-containing protein [Algoriphagus sp.]|uniref:STAS/SEC14 domain-containing protein n=1 Tax=Algoriphagus sp. TaxID=1872435 RepID=UPI00327C1EDA